MDGNNAKAWGISLNSFPAQRCWLPWQLSSAHSLSSFLLLSFLHNGAQETGLKEQFAIEELEQEEKPCSISSEPLEHWPLWGKVYESGSETINRFYPWSSEAFEFQLHGYLSLKRVKAKCNWQRKAISESLISKVNLVTINPYKEVHCTQTYTTWNLARLIIMGNINPPGQTDVFIALIHTF